MKTLLRRRWAQGIIACFVLLSSSAYAEFKVGLVLDKGGKDDKSFNAAAYKGASDAHDQLGVTVKTVEATDDNSYQPLLRSLAQRDYDLIVAIGVSQRAALEKVAAQFPAKRFAIVDAEVKGPNVRSLLFQEHEGSYLVGAIAAKVSKTGKLGFIGGMDIPLIRRFQMGFEAGAKKENPSAKVTANYIGITVDAWNNPAKAKELALTQYEGGSDVIFAAAGASNSGLFDAAEEKKKLAIGVDSNQDWIKPGFILTSMLKRVDVAVLATIREAKDGKFAAGTARFGLANGGIDFSIDDNNRKLIPPEVLKEVEKLKAEIIAGKIKVPDYYVVHAQPKT